MAQAISQEELLRRMLQCGGVSEDAAENAAIFDLVERHDREQQRVETLVSGSLLVGRAAHRTVGRAGAGEMGSCRWCDGRKFAHHAECPIRVLIDIVMLVSAKSDEDRQIARDALGRIQSAEVV